ncbi:MAG: hypothetical protein B6I38_01695 [Anaerolineaceae bacterium 4572_5.1]|nr:MAG: hypothetical protein B6I38_01695 [Anaerolineaceae bacterium 4572_5.1]
MQAELKLSTQIVAEMRHHVFDCAPLEACGLLSGRSERAENVFLITNATQSRVRFRMDTQEQYNAFLQIEDQGQELLGIFHSHSK